jgi:hypothetical protein
LGGIGIKGQPQFFAYNIERQFKLPVAHRSKKGVLLLSSLWHEASTLKIIAKNKSFDI